ncbi:MAG: hypothetical protein LBR90_04855, partial [Elusimicrobiota bacterium]|nr:hypothetical protein [Elusimicrobiota bacterium]
MINGLHLFIAVPLFFAALCAFLNRRPRLAAAIANAVFVSGFLYACYNFAANFGAPWFAGEAVYSAFLLIIIFLVSAAVAFFANFAASTKRRGSYFAVLLIAAAGMAGVALAKDFFTLYVYLEVVSVTSFALIAFYNRPKSTEGAIKYFYLSAIASAIILFSVSLLVLHTGGSSYQGLVDVALKNQNPAALSIILGLMALAFMIKTGLFPFHTWTPDAYEAASSPISALMAGIVTKIAGAYALVIICVLLVIINQGLGGVSKAIMWYGLISILFGALAAQEQKDFKRMLAYSSISQMGYIVLA